MTSARHSRFFAWLLAALLIAVQTAALAHELDHALDKHDELCALHIYADHHGGLAAADTALAASPPQAAGHTPAPPPFFSRQRPAPYAVRAPPPPETPRYGAIARLGRGSY